MTFLFLCQQQLLPHSPLPTVFLHVQFFLRFPLFFLHINLKHKKPINCQANSIFFLLFLQLFDNLHHFFLKTHEVKLSHLHKTYKLLLHFSLIQDVEYYTTALTYSITHFAFSSFRFHDIIIRSFECPECFQINSPPFLLYRCAPLSFYHS